VVSGINRTVRFPIWRLYLVVTILGGAIFSGGCAEGPLWRTGHYAPWARKKWEQEEAFADTLFKKKRVISEIASRGEAGGLKEKNAAAEELAEYALKDPIILVRIQAVRQLGNLNCPSSHDVLRQAGRDPEPQVRMTAVDSWRRMPTEIAVPALHQILNSDNNIDVRLAATKGLGDHSGSAAIGALRVALSDSDPAIRKRGMQAMARSSGEKYGEDLKAWRQYADQILGNREQLAEENSAMRR
jgi:HEAT repeat protein